MLQFTKRTSPTAPQRDSVGNRCTMFFELSLNLQNVLDNFVFGRGQIHMTTLSENRLNADHAIYQRMTSIFRGLFEDNTIILRPDTSESDIAGWDSFNNASLIAAIEKEFAIRFRTAELQSLHNVGTFVDIIRAKLQTRSRSS